MWRWRQYFAKFRNLFRRSRAEEELAREIGSHLALLEEDFQRRGMTPLEARLAARRAYGGIEQAKELHRDERSIVWLEQTLRDIQYACRNLVRNPGFALVVALTLTLGIGVNATLFSAYNAVALKPLPVADPNQVVRLERWFQHGYKGDIQYAFSYPEYIYCQDHNDVFSNLVAASWPHRVVAESAGDKHEPGAAATVQLVSANYFSALGIAPQLGRTFLPEEGRVPGANTVAVISYPFWRRWFHGEPETLGKVIKINGVAFTIIGITPDEFTGTSTLPQVPDLWAPVSIEAQLLPGSDWLHQPDNAQVQILAHLKAGTSLERAQAETNSLMRQYATTFQPRERTIAITLQHTAFFGNTNDPRFKLLVTALMLLVGSVLLVACANVANMLLARGAARYREIGTRLALGASRSRIIRQLLTESILLAMLGGVGGLVASVWTTKLLWISIEQVFAGLLPGSVEFSLDLTPDAHVFVYAFVLSLATGMGFGLSPALQFSRPDIVTALKERRWTRLRTRNWLIAMQVGVSIVLLVITGLLLRGLVRSQATSPGFETHNVVLLGGEFGSDPAKGAVLKERLVERLENVPGVKSVALGTVPFLGTWTPRILIERSGARQTKPNDRTLASYASHTYFATLGIALLRGRGFTKRETANDAHVAVISKSTARRFWPGENALGKRFKLDLDFRGNLTEFEVVGIAKDVRLSNLSRIDPARVYVPTRTKDVYWILLRSQGSPEAAMASVRTAVQDLDRNLLARLWVTTLEKGPLHLQRSLAQIYAMYAGILAFLAAALAAVGICGVMAYLVNQRVAEIGIRMALGATARDVVKSIVIEGLRPAFWGITLGLAVAAALSSLLHTTLLFPGSPDFFYGVPFYDPVTFVGLTVFFLFIAAVAAFMPARRAVRIDPVAALRYD